MLLSMITLIIWVICLHFKLMNKNRKYLGDTSSLKRRLKLKDNKIYTLERRVFFYKQLKNYERYLNE